MSVEQNPKSVAYSELFRHVCGLYAKGGFPSLATFAVFAMNDLSESDDTLFQRLNAIVRAAGGPTPTVSFMRALHAEIDKLKPEVSEPRKAMIADMMRQIGLHLCHVIVEHATASASLLAAEFGAAVDITADSQGPDDADWKSIGGEQSGPVVLH